MSILLALLGKAWPYMLAAFVGGAVAGWTTHAFDSIALNRQKAAMAGYKAQVADQDKAAEIAAREALQAQIDQRHVVDRNNEQVMDDLRKRTAEAESHYDADRAFIKRMLNTASTSPTPQGDPVRESDGRLGSAGAGGTNAVEQVADLCSATKAEDERNADRLDSLIAQIKPQVQP